MERERLGLALLDDDRSERRRVPADGRAAWSVGLSRMAGRTGAREVDTTTPVNTGRATAYPEKRLVKGRCRVKAGTWGMGTPVPPRTMASLIVRTAAGDERAKPIGPPELVDGHWITTFEDSEGRRFQFVEKDGE